MVRSWIETPVRWIGALAAALALAACGGGSGGCVDAFGGTACGSDGGGTPAPAQTVAKLSLSLSAASIANTGSESVVATAVATNADNQVISGAPVVLRVDDGAQIAVDGATTDSAGKLTGTVTIGDNRDNRVVTVTALANNGDLVVSKTFRVVGATLSGTTLPTVVAPGANGVVQFRLVDANSNAMPDAPITVTGPGGVQSTAVTDLNGYYSYGYVAPTASGEIAIVASAGGAEYTANVLVQPAAGGSVPVATAAVASATATANPSVIAVNADGGTTNQSQIRALFLGFDNKPVKNVRVRFDLPDPNSVGGTVASGSSVVYTDANGVATTSYIAGTRGSPTDGVVVRACWSLNDTLVCDGAHQTSTTLTVVDNPVSVSIGTNALISIGTSGLTYVKRYVVQVVDSSGVAKPDVQVSASVDLVRYSKGQWVVGSSSWGQLTNASCDNEDLNRNAVIETYADGWVEDVNSNGRLDPRKADVAVSFESGSRTDASGSVVLRLEYPQNVASWVEFALTVSTAVDGSEGRASYNGVLPVDADAVSDVNVPPPFVLSPYGTATSPVVTKTYGGRTSVLCTNPN